MGLPRNNQFAKTWTSLVYGQKNILRKRKRNIEEFFTKKLATFVGVKSLSSPVLQPAGDVNLYVTVDIEKVDDFIKDDLPRIQK